MNGRVLDSNIVIDLFRGNNATKERLKSITKIYIPVIVFGELYYGANLSNQFPTLIEQHPGLSNKVVVPNGPPGP